MVNLFQFYSALGLELQKRDNEKFFTGQLTNKEGTTLSVIHTGNVHRLNCENNGMFCQIIPNSKIDITDIDFVIKFLSKSVFLKRNFPNIYQQILLLNTETVE